MSDEEDEYEYEYDDDDEPMAEDEDNQFEYTDDEEEQDDAEVALENAYYNAKGLREVDLGQAADALEKVIVLEKEELEKSGSDKSYGPWSYKAMKQLVKLHLRAAASNSNSTGGETGSPTMILQQYNRLLECVSTGDVSPAAVEKGISGMLERVARTYGGGGGGGSNNVSASNSVMDDAMTDSSDAVESNPQSLALAVYDATLKVFHPVTGPCKNERLWFKTNLKYGQLLYEMNETAKLQQVLKDLLAIHNINTSGAATGSSTNSMEIYALQIQLYSRQKDHKKLRETYQRAMNVMGGIPHPRTLALIHELGGKMHMAAREYEAAGKTFFQAFKSYDEAGDPSRLRCLKYLVLASMLHASSINPFDSQEARPYRDDPEIVAMTELVQAFHNNEITTFEKILKKHSKQLLGDEFIREHVEDLLRTIRTQVLRRVIRPYSRISLEAIAAELNDIPVTAVEQLLVHLILEGNLDGKIDRINAVLLKKPEKGGGDGKSGSAAGAGVGGSGQAASASIASAGSETEQASSNAKSDTLLQCQAMEQMIGLLDDLSTQVTTTSQWKEGLPGGAGGSGMGSGGRSSSSGVIGSGTAAAMRGMVAF